MWCGINIEISLEQRSMLSTTHWVATKPKQQQQPSLLLLLLLSQPADVTGRRPPWPLHRHTHTHAIVKGKWHAAGKDERYLPAGLLCSPPLGRVGFQCKGSSLEGCGGVIVCLFNFRCNSHHHFLRRSVATMGKKEREWLER